RPDRGPPQAPPGLARGARRVAAGARGVSRVRRSGPPPARSSRRAEGLLLGGDLWGGLHQPRRRGWPAEEVGLDLSHLPATELDVAVARAFVGRRRLTARD